MSDEASTGPVVLDRDEQPYAGDRRNVTKAVVVGVAHRIPKLLERLDRTRCGAIRGAVLQVQRLIDMDADLEVEVGAPVPLLTRVR